MASDGSAAATPGVGTAGREEEEDDAVGSDAGAWWLGAGDAPRSSLPSLFSSTWKTSRAGEWEWERGTCQQPVGQQRERQLTYLVQMVVHSMAAVVPQMRNWRNALSQKETIENPIPGVGVRVKRTGQLPTSRR